MKTAIFTLILLIFSGVASAQTAIDAFGNKIIYTKPDEKRWTLVKETNPSEGSKGIRIFKHAKITNDKRVPTEPVISLVYEQVKGEADAMYYSLNGLKSIQESLDLTWDVLGGYPEYSSDRHAVVYKARYFKGGITHKVYISYILCNGTGVVITGDATEDVFSQVDDDMRAFIKSVTVQTK